MRIFKLRANVSITASLGLMALLVGLCAPRTSVAQTSFKNGQQVLAQLNQSGNAKFAKSWLANGEEVLSLYLGRKQVGKLALRNIINEAGELVFVDDMELTHQELGRAVLQSNQRFSKTGQLLQATLVTSAPIQSGKLVKRRYSLEFKSTNYLWSATDETTGKTQTKTIDAASVCLSLPAGLAMRLPRMSVGMNRVSFNAIDIKTGNQERLKLDLGPKVEQTFRYTKTNIQTVKMAFGDKNWSISLGPESKLLAFHLGSTQLFSIVGGLTSSERFQGLPEPAVLEQSTPKTVAIRFMRALARGLQEEVETFLDFAELYQFALKKRNKTGTKEGAAAFKKLLLAKLLDFNWLLKQNISVNSTSLTVEQLKVETQGKKTDAAGQLTVVTMPGGGRILLRNKAGAWKVVGVASQSQK